MYKNRFKKILIFIFILLITLLPIGCSQPSKEITSQPQEIKNEDATAETTIKDDDIKIDLIDKVRSPLTGLYIDTNQLNDRVIAVMIDNHSKARPQAGISQCDIVYEMPVEGNITRYMGIWESEKPSNIGPIRSARHYFIHRSLEYDALYVHVGGSPQADQAISNLGIPSVSAMNLGKEIFWRKNHKYAPHNMYSSYEALIKGANRRNYRTKGEYKSLLFLHNEKEINGSTVSYIEFPYNRKKYFSSYQYDENEKVFYRYVNGNLHLDENDDIQITAKNILVQFIDTQLIPGDKEGRLNIAMVGEGKGLYLSNGKYQEIIWKKSSQKSLTRYYDKSGKEIKFNPGNFWIQVYPKNRCEEIKIESLPTDNSSDINL